MAYYATRRMATARGATRFSSASVRASWAPNRNAVRHTPRVTLGPISHTATVLIMVLLVGLIYLTQSTKATNYDAEIAKVDEQITSLEAQRDALAVENAKITAAAADEDSNKLASSMISAGNAEYVAR